MPGSDDLKAASRVKLTYEDFLLFPEDGKRHELIDGEPVEAALDSTPTSARSSRLQASSTIAAAMASQSASGCPSQTASAKCRRSGIGHLHCAHA